MYAVRVESAKTRASSSTLEWITGFALFEFGKVAVSAGPFGTVRGLQFAAAFQSFVVGLTVHLALPAKAVADATSRNTSVGATASELRMPRRRRGDRLMEVFTIELLGE